LGKSRRDTRTLAGEQAISAVEHLSIKQHDRMHETMGSDIGHECVELRRRERWKQKARGMKR
jgi:hypothetical protein